MVAHFSGKQPISIIGKVAHNFQGGRGECRATQMLKTVPLGERIRAEGGEIQKEAGYQFTNGRLRASVVRLVSKKFLD